ncbi:MAG: DUF6438 domain-containing protein [Bacteroidota bacterium]
MKLLSVLVPTLIALMILSSCNPDATGVKSDAPPTVIAPAPAPKPKTGNDVSTPERTAPTRPEDSAVPASELAEPPAGDPFAIGKAGPGRQQPKVTPEPEPAPQRPVNAPPKAAAPQVLAPLVFSVRKTPCYGDCEQYRLDLHEDGTLVYDGKRNVRRKGLHQRELTIFQYRDLVEAFQSLNVTDLAEIYPEDRSKIPTDIPSTVLTFPTEDGEEKQVTVYFEAPEALQEFLDLVAATTTTGVWTPNP